MYRQPTTRRENDRITKDFTQRLAGFAKLLGNLNHGAYVEKIEPSGNAGEDDDAYMFSVQIDGLTFHVEVFGPYWEQ